jgi:hypothetical protein
MKRKKNLIIKQATPVKGKGNELRKYLVCCGKNF